MSIPKKQSVQNFLSMENYNNLEIMIQNFMYKTYNIGLYELYEQEEFLDILRIIMRNIDTSNKNLSFADKNRMVILNVRNMIFEKKNNTDQGSDESIIPPARPEIDREDTDENVNKDEIFFQKLQELEQRRKVAPGSSQLAAEPQVQSIIQSQLPLNVAPNPTPSQTVQEQVVVAISPPPRQGITHIISSWERQLSDSPERANFMWNKSLPTMIDPLGTCIAGLFLPVSVYNYTPYIKLYIEGASGANTACVLYPESSPMNRNRGWLRWIPMNNSLSYIRNISSPWTIQLLCADNTLLPLGRDMMHIESISIDVTNHSASIITSPRIQEGDFMVGDQLWIYTNNERKKTEVLSICNDRIEVRYQQYVKANTISQGVNEWIHARILNYSRQWSVILDLTRTENGKK